MKQSASAPRSASTRTLLLFSLVVGVLVIGSLVGKLYTLITQSKYDGNHRFTLSIQETPMHYTIISFSPQSKATSVVTVSDTKPLSTPEKLLGVPIDGKVRVTSSFSRGDSTADLMSALVANMHKIETNLTIIDLLRLSFAAKGQSGRNEAKETITEPGNIANNTDIATKLFHESIFETENLTIQIMNGTDVSGVGKRLERVFTTIGGNVVSIANSDTPEKLSKIVYFGEKSGTVERIEKMLGYPSEVTETQGISDIMILVGEDRVKQLPY